MSGKRPAAFVIKTAIADPTAATFRFTAQKTMYGGRLIAAGDRIFLFASENEGGRGLIARGRVTAAEPTPRKPGVARQTPRVSIEVGRLARTKRALGRAELKAFRGSTEDRPEAELDFKLYRQATDKIVGVSAATAAFLNTF